MKRAIGDVDPARGIDGHPGRLGELTAEVPVLARLAVHVRKADLEAGAAAVDDVLADREDEVPGRVELLHAVVDEVGDVDVPCGVGGDPLRTVETSAHPGSDPGPAVDRIGADLEAAATRLQNVSAPGSLPHPRGGMRWRGGDAGHEQGGGQRAQYESPPH
jgi:hypothetical protein